MLVSDGKETCEGDPTVAARALAAKGITVHTVGLHRRHRSSWAAPGYRQGDGRHLFRRARRPLELPDTLKSAFGACKKRVAKLPTKPKPGKLRTTSAIYTHDIINAETGQKVAVFDRVQYEVELPAGIYEVKFGPGSWKGIEVRPGETTTIEPGS